MGGIKNMTRGFKLGLLDLYDIDYMVISKRIIIADYKHSKDHVKMVDITDFELVELLELIQN